MRKPCGNYRNYEKILKIMIEVTSIYLFIYFRTREKGHMKSLYLFLKWFNHIYFSIVEMVTSSPPGMQLTSLRYNEGVYYRNVTWYPSEYQVGQQAFCFKAVDSSGWEDIFLVILVSWGVIHSPKTFEMRIHRMKIVFHLKNLPCIYYRWANNERNIFSN